MITAITVVGLITLLAISAAIFAAVHNYFRNLREKREEKRFRVAKEKAAREIGQTLRNASWWFSESEEARIVLDLIGERLARDAVFDESPVRDMWRQLLAARGGVDIEQFLSEKCRRSEGVSTPLKDFYAAYLAFCEDRRLAPQGIKGFANKVRRSLLYVEQKTIGGRTVWTGISL